MPGNVDYRDGVKPWIQRELERRTATAAFTAVKLALTG